MHAYLDGELEGAVGKPKFVRRHLERCGTCAARLEVERAVRHEAASILEGAQWPVEVPPLEDLRRRASVAAEPDPKRGVFTHPLARFAWAASIALALGAGWLLRGGEGEGGRGLDSALETGAGLETDTGLETARALETGAAGSRAKAGSDPLSAMASVESTAAGPREAPVGPGGASAELALAVPDEDDPLGARAAAQVPSGAPAHLPRAGDPSSSAEIVPTGVAGQQARVAFRAADAANQPPSEAASPTSRPGLAGAGAPERADSQTPWSGPDPARVLALRDDSVPADYLPVLVGLAPATAPPLVAAPVSVESRLGGMRVVDGMILQPEASVVTAGVRPCPPEPGPDGSTDGTYGRALAQRSASFRTGTGLARPNVGRARAARSAESSAAIDCVPAPMQTSETIEEAAGTITETDFLYKVGVIAHDSMGGRDTPSPGLEMTARWISSELAAAGVVGGAEGGYIQRYPLRRVTVLHSSILRIGDTSLALGTDFIPLTGDLEPTKARGRLVLVEPGGTGSVDFADADVDLADTDADLGPADATHAVFLAPGGVSAGLYREALSLRAEVGVASVSIAIGKDAPRSPWASGTPEIRPSLAMGRGDADGGPEPQPPVLLVRYEALDAALVTLGVELDAIAFDAGVGTSGADATLQLMVENEHLDAPNVVGVIPGSDPALAHEYVVYSAHMDHMGTGPPDAEGDSIFNGADDDASGTVAVLEVAQAVASLTERPRRSMLFVLVSGEEKGLWGSEWFSDNPPVPAQSMVANLNADMVSRNWTDTIVAIGKEHSDLGATLENVNEARPELGMTAIDDLWPEENFYCRSDHYNFARKGVPILFFFNGTHEDYHGRNDEVERIDAEKAARVAKLMFYLGVEVANADERPEWTPGTRVSDLCRR